jgi:hypothetical protein
LQSALRAELPENERDDFFQALEVAATVDDLVSQPERRILRGAARVLGRTYDGTRTSAMPGPAWRTAESRA